jgi:hypothetical protein
MITTIVDKNYLYREARYLLSSIYKYMPEEKIYLFLVNCNEEVKKDILKWNPNTIIDFRTFDVPKEQYKSYMYVMMTFTFDWLLNEIQVKENIIYLDADMVLKGSLENLYKYLEKYDLIFRYQPFNRIKGPTTKELGGIMNNGCVVMKNNNVMSEYAKRLKKNIQDYLNNGKDPVIYVEEAQVITCIDQEMEFTTYLEMKNKIKFFPLNIIYNDTHFTKEGIVWHAKGVHRTYPEYLIECWKYGREDINIIKEYLRSYYKKLKIFIKSFFIEPEQNLYIKELEDILSSIKIEKIIIINSNFYLDNIKILKIKKFNIKCFDTDPVIYYKNKEKLEKEKIFHKYIIYDVETIKEECDLLICEKNNLKIISNLNYKNKICKEKI